MKRRMDWPERMNDALDAARARPFADDYHCATFAADLVLAMTGEDPMPQRHATVAGAYRAMREEGFSDVREQLAAMFGPAVHVSRARRGDVILHENEQGFALGICCGDRSAFLAADGVTFHPTIKQVEAYRVPF